jgi:choice-of-anchor C domain-containing protein
VEAIDPSEDALVYSLETAPDSMAIDPNTGEIVWNPTAEELYQVPEDGSGPMTFFGEDISNLGDSSRLSATPNADSARDDFLSKLVGVETEDFESFAHGERPSSLTFGTDTADFLGNPYVINIANGTYNGTFPTSGDKLLLQQPGAGPFEIEFSYPQAAFGFYATDVGDAGSKLVVELYHSDGEITEIYAPQELTVTPTGSALYFGVIDVENPLTKVKLTNDNDSAEGFGFDDMTIGRLEQVSIPPVDVTVRVSDGRGGVDTQSFQIEVKEPLGEIQGTIWNDVSGEGLREDSETGLSGVEVYLDLNENGELDPDEPTTLTDSRGEYRFSDLTAGKYVVREVLPEGLEYTFPDATPLLGPNLLKNGSFEDGPRDFSGSYKTLYDGSTEINNWNVGGEVDYMFGPYQLTPEQFASVERTSDGEIALDLVGIQPGSLSQTFETVPGKDYLVTFDLSANPGIKAGVGVVMEVKAAEQSGLFVGVSTGSYNSMEYQTHSWEFTANSELTTLELLAETYFPAAGPFVDNVSVSEVTPDIKQIVSLGAGQTVKNIDFGNTKLDPAVKNSPPTFTSTNTTDTATVGELWSYQATATDPDFDPLTYFLIAKPDGMTVNPETGLVVWKPTYEQINETLVDTFGGEQPGIYNLVIGAKDGNGGIDVQSFEVEVIATDKPVIVSGDALAPAAVGKPYEYRFHAQNADGTTLTYRLDTQLEGMSLDETTGVLTWTPTDSQLGEQLVTVAVIDAETGDETSRDFNFTVVANAPNSPPTITSTPRQRVRIGDNYLYTVDATDPNNDPLTYVLETAPFGMRIGVDGRIFWQPTSADAGINAISIVVSDSRGGEVKQEYELAVTSTGENRPPSITSTPKGAATIAQQYEYNLTGSDPDGDEYWWSLDTAPQGMSIDPEAGTIRWEPNVSQVGSHEVAVRLTDANGAFVGQAFSISVRGVNVPPVITSTPLTEAVASKSYNYVVQAEDVEGDALTFSLVNPRSGMTVDGDTGLIEWIPLAVGEIDVEVVVEDALGAVTRQTYQIAVSETAANLPPTITSAPVSFASIGKKYEYEVTAADPDGDDVTYQLLEVPDETMTVSDTGLIEWVPTTEGVYTVAVGAVDRFGLGGAQRFTVDVALAVEPIVASTPVSSVTAGAVYRYQINATSVKGERISYSLESAPEGMSVDEFGRVVWMPDSGDIGSYDVAISIYDPRGNSVLQSFELTVEADREAPKVSLFVSNERVGLD